MTELTCWPLDNKQYYSNAMGAAYAARSRGLLHSTDFSATVNGDNSITLTKGVGCIHVTEFWAAFPFSQNDIVLQFEDADGVYPRWDVAVIGYDKNGNAAGIYTRSGIPAQEPVYPEIRQDDEFDEIFLYAVKRPVGATQIRAEDIVDLRINQDYCGLMRDTIDAIDTKVMQAAFESFLDKIEAELERLNAGTEAMTKTEYDPEGNGIDITVQTYTHTKTGAIHEFTGSGANGRAKMTANVAEGDTFTVNGSPVSAYLGVDEAAGSMAGSEYTGRWVTFVYDSEAATLNFKGGGGRVTVEGLSAGAIDKDVTVTVKQGAKTVQSVTGTLWPSIANLSAGNIKKGVTVTVKQGAKTVQSVAGTLTIDGLLSTLIKNTIAVQKQDYVASTHTFTIPKPASGSKTLMVFVDLYIYHYQAQAESRGTCQLKNGGTVLATAEFHRYKTAYTNATVAVLINPSINAGPLTLVVTGTDGNFVQITGGYIWTY